MTHCERRPRGYKWVFQYRDSTNHAQGLVPERRQLRSSRANLVLKEPCRDLSRYLAQIPITIKILKQLWGTQIESL